MTKFAKVDFKITPRIIWLPGLGADWRIFRPQLQEFSNSLVVNWILPDHNETLELYANRLSQLIDHSPHIPTVVCGLSFGGIIAPYVAKNIGASTCIIISSVRSPSQFPKRYYVTYLLLKIFPWFLSIFVFITQLVVRLLLFIPCVQYFNLYFEVFNQLVSIKSLYLVRIIKMMLSWAYETGDMLDKKWSLRILHIHGTNDWLLPINLVKPDFRIEGAGHCITLSHPETIIEIINSVLVQEMTENYRYNS
jgi:pimeloyl-ACP methyl ester carboxylesterase